MNIDENLYAYGPGSYSTFFLLRFLALFLRILGVGIEKSSFFLAFLRILGVGIVEYSFPAMNLFFLEKQLEQGFTCLHV